MSAHRATRPGRWTGKAWAWFRPDCGVLGKSAFEPVPYLMSARTRTGDHRFRSVRVRVTITPIRQRGVEVECGPVTVDEDHAVLCLRRATAIEKGGS